MGHRLAFWVPLLVGAAVATGCGDTNPTGSFELTGRVLEVNTEEPVSGALVIFRSDTLYTNQDQTSGGGWYQMGIETDSPFGQVRAEHPGYIPDEETVFFDGPQRRVDIRLVPLDEPEMMEE
jgi:hypothetical protein